MQKAESVSPVQVQVLSGLQLSGEGQLPQLAVRVCPQASVPVKLPQTFPARAQKAESESAQHWFWKQTPEVQVPQLMVRGTPHESSAVTGPHAFPRRVQKAAFVSVVQPKTPHTFRTPPPPQTAGSVQVPQVTVRGAPQLSSAETGSHVLPRRAQNVASSSGWQQPWFEGVQVPRQHR